MHIKSIYDKQKTHNMYTFEITLKLHAPQLNVAYKSVATVIGATTLWESWNASRLQAIAKFWQK